MGVDDVMESMCRALNPGAGGTQLARSGSSGSMWRRAVAGARGAKSTTNNGANANNSDNESNTAQVGIRVTRYPISIWRITMSIVSSPMSLAHIPDRYPG